MTQEDSFLSAHSEPVSHVNANSFFSVTASVTFKPMMAGPEREARHLNPTVTRLVSFISLGAVLLGPLSGCGSDGNTTTVPCAVPSPAPTSAPIRTPVSTRTPTITCTTKSGRRYLWFPTLGGWVQSDDGLHPNPNAHGVGADDGHGGVGEGHGGTEHGG